MCSGMRHTVSYQSLRYVGLKSTYRLKVQGYAFCTIADLHGALRKMPKVVFLMSFPI